mgnify:CR=1 FL=1
MKKQYTGYLKRGIFKKYISSPVLWALILDTMSDIPLTKTDIKIKVTLEYNGS